MLQRYFLLTQNGTSVRTEVIAGLSSFLATMYIIVVNPAILSQAGMPFGGVLTATVLLSFFCSLMMGLYARNPLLVAPGMGLNAFFTFAVVKGIGVPWQTALGAVFWAGILFLILSIFNVRTYIVQAIPKPLRYAISSGIGLFITLIGLTNAKFIVSNPATLVSIGNLKDPILLTFLLGLIITAILVVKKVQGGIVIGIVLTTLAAIPIGRWWGDASVVNFGQSTLVNWSGFWAAPDFSLLLQLDLTGSLTLALWPVIFAFAFTDLFDSLSTFVGVAEAANLHDENGDPRNIRQSLLTDAVATTLAGLLGTSPGTAYIESAVGIEQGGRTGLTAVVAAFLFLPFMFLSPLLSVIPGIATAPALILVGAFMMKPVTKIDWSRMDEAIPCLLALVLIPFSYSITQGIIFGFLSWTILKTAAGKGKEISLTLWVIDIFAVMSLVWGH
ncbi:NCS2 family permease [Runella slithyformis]|uniref:Xanthine/uracil/vitamin C permease n=1 Tax=Runella slithyformis (strain ATCC 29530 / DSM 19594 / LMG 11500 / NCIMB 11436 / LSU 4) TaxID=761193 RepID=A0A7U4E6A6_RUNSL|nr:NCS2 family permease [Runella slithyformis]AEI49338.1 Xanthine/uracil/vitamin C permease [Runella slithyformis DSM 19594]